jgi:hypothetical protein
MSAIRQARTAWRQVQSDTADATDILRSVVDHD